MWLTIYNFLILLCTTAWLVDASSNEKFSVVSLGPRETKILKENSK